MPISRYAPDIKPFRKKGISIMKKAAKSVESMCCENQSPAHKASPDSSEWLYPDYDAEAEEIRQMKEEFDRMAHDMLEQIDTLLTKIDGILSRDRDLSQIAYTRNLSAEDREFLMHGNSKLEA